MITVKTENQTIEFDPTREYQFNHPKGSFTGIPISSDENGMLEVLMTSKGYGFHNSEYYPGETRWIRPGNMIFSRTKSKISIK